MLHLHYIRNETKLQIYNRGIDKKNYKKASKTQHNKKQRAAKYAAVIKLIRGEYK
jgi:hypothetical protein